MTHRFYYVSLLLVAMLGTLAGITVTPTIAQDKVLIIGERPMIDVERSLKLVQTGSSTIEATTNREKLQAAINAGAFRYPWFFPGGTNFSIWHVDDTISLLNDQGRAWEGCGVTRRASGTVRGSILGIRSTNATDTVWATDFDGFGEPAKYLETSGASATVTVVGRTVSPLDRYGAVEITGGTNAIAGWYDIASVDTIENTWTLDRACTTDTETNITAYYCPTLVRNHGIGTVVKGMHFTGMAMNADSGYGRNGTIGWHVASRNISGGITTGKNSFYDCMFSNFDTGILLGRGMAEAYGGGSGPWVGSQDDHADTLRLHNVFFQSVRSAVHARNLQSVGHDFSAITVNSLNGYAFNFDSGGKVSASGINLSGGGYDSRQCLLRLGREVRRENSGYYFTNVGFDGGDNTWNPQYVVTDWEGLEKFATVVINGGTMNRADNEPNDGPPIDRTSPENNRPLIDVQSRATVVVRDIGVSVNEAAFWPGSIRIREGASDYAPRITIENCCLTYTTNPSELLHSESNAGKVKLINCWRSDGTEVADQTLEP